MIWVTLVVESMGTWKLTGYILDLIRSFLKVKGEFHIAFGRKAESSGDDATHIHRFSPLELFTFNCSHTIHRLSFGEDFPGVVQPLDGITQIVNSGLIPVTSSFCKGLGRFQYFINVVPTIYEYSNGRRVGTNQYSATEHNKEIHPEGGSFKQPGWTHCQCFDLFKEFSFDLKFHLTQCIIRNITNHFPICLQVYVPLLEEFM
jgi:hypothetical protein